MSTFSADVADLFCQLYDLFDRHAFRDPDEVLDLLGTVIDDDEFLSAVEQTALEAPVELPDRVPMWLPDQDDPEARNRRILQMLVALDRVLVLAHPQLGSHDAAELAHVQARYWEHGRFSTDAINGALVPRFTHARHSQLPESIDDLLESVVRVPQAAWVAAQHVTINAESDLVWPPSDGLVVSCCPFVADLDGEATIESVSRDRALFYVVHPNAAALEARVTEVLDRLDECGATIAVLPEMASNPPLREAWSAAIWTKPRPTDSQLAWIMIGTGPTETRGGTFSENRAVVLSRVTGETLFTQDKVMPFRLTAEQVRDWGLAPPLTEADHDEGIVRGDMLTVAESSTGRVVVLICEDLARVPDHAAVLGAHNPSLLLSPVFAPPIVEWHWEHQASRAYSASFGPTVIVANSLAIGHAMGHTPPRNTCLAHSPAGSHLLGETADPAATLTFRITASDVELVERVEPL